MIFVYSAQPDITPTLNIDLRPTIVRAHGLLRTKQELYDAFIEGAGKYYTGQSFSMSYFNSIWRNRRSKLKSKQGGTGRS